MKFKLGRSDQDGRRLSPSDTALSPGWRPLGRSGWVGRCRSGAMSPGFSLGLMAVLRDSSTRSGFRSGTTDGGMGFGLGGSRMGCTTHLTGCFTGLFPLLRPATRPVWSFIPFLGGLGTYWAARRFGASPQGAALAGFAWSASGFFLIHLPHQWGYTVGAWMPWAWGLTWLIIRKRRKLAPIPPGRRPDVADSPRPISSSLSTPRWG